MGNFLGVGDEYCEVDVCDRVKDRGRRRVNCCRSISYTVLWYNNLKKRDPRGGGVRSADCRAMDSNVKDEQDVSSSQANRPLWNYVTKIGKCARGGNVSFICNYCQMKYMGSYSRVKAHLLRISGKGIRACSSINASEVEEMKRLEEEASKRIDNGTRDLVPVPEPNSSQASSSPTCTPFIAPVSMRLPSPEGQGSGYKRRKPNNQFTLDEMFSGATNREELDLAFARMFYSCGLPFGFARNSFFRDAVTILASKRLPGYTPPTPVALRTNLLEKEKARIEKELQPIKDTWEKKGVTIVVDGWTDSQRFPMINFMAVNDSGAIFLQSLICVEEIRTDLFISQLMKEVIDGVGSSNVIQIITENDPVCQRTGKIIEDTFPQISWTPNVLHNLDLALKSIFSVKESNEMAMEEFYWISNTIETVKMIKNFIINHPNAVDIFTELPALQLLELPETRFASAVVTLRQFRSLMYALKRIVIHEQWPSWNDDKNEASLMRTRILDTDDSLKDTIDYILAFTKPIYDMMKVCNSDSPSLHLIYEMWDSVMMNVKAAIFSHELKSMDDESSTFWNAVSKILNTRLAESITPLHAVAHSLNPRCTTREWKEEHPNLLPLESDAIIASLRNQFLQRYYPDDHTRAEVKQEFAKFMGCLQDFGTPESIRYRLFLAPIEWWYTFGYIAPHLQKLAFKLLGHVSSSACQRNWGTYSFIHLAFRRNLEFAQDLVYVHNNLRLISRRSKEYTEGESILWDVAGDGFDSLDPIGLLSDASLWLDEPEFQASVFPYDIPS